ncbi:hypothetical protein GCM10009554_69080 [Kribbella koreensis]|uniref:DUF3592 domain-containing protein n=1 Tax=Kribbella koreensis TaxID=57909 RepID=A0ABN1RIC6_9ACTN
MSDDDDGTDDLYGRQLVLLLLFFGGTAGLLLLIAWLARPNWMWDGPLVAFAIAGGACYPARLLVERFAWWKRLEQPTQWTVARRERAAERERKLQREYRRQERDGKAREGQGRHAGRRRFRIEDLLVRLLGLVLVLGSLAIIPFGLGAGRSDERLARTAPVQQAVVVSVDEDKWSKNHDLTIKVARPGDGGTVEIYGADEIDPRPAVGDKIGVYVDPHDPGNVLAADADWTMHWYWYVLCIAVSLVLAGFSSMLLW